MLCALIKGAMGPNHRFGVVIVAADAIAPGINSNLVNIPNTPSSGEGIGINGKRCQIVADIGSGIIRSRFINLVPMLPASRVLTSNVSFSPDTIRSQDLC